MKRPLAVNLRKARRHHELTQAKAASALGLSIPSYQAYEEDRAEPSAQNLVVLAELFGIYDLVSFIKDPNFNITNQRMHIRDPKSSPILFHQVTEGYKKTRGANRIAVDVLLGLRKIP